MREPPPVQLTELLQRLGLATASDLQSAEATVRRLAGDLPQFQSVWIDALQQAGRLTHFQAGEIMAGRGDDLRVGRYVVCHIVQECGYSTVYKAEDVETKAAVRLACITGPLSLRERARVRADGDYVAVSKLLPTKPSPPAPLPEGEGRITALLNELQELAALGQRLPQLSGLIDSVGQDGPRLWAASPWVEGTSLAEWMLHHGRVPPEVVLEVAHAMLSDLAAMEAVGLVHGDIRAENVLLLFDGGICLPHAGLRSIIRPQEGIAHGNLAPDACGGLAPERVTGGLPPTAASDLFACGCVWWQMLCGRPPLGGGDTLARLRAAQTAAIDDFHHWAGDVPKQLDDAVAACLQKDPRQRPASMTDLARQLGPPRRNGRQAIVRCLAAAGQPYAPWLRAKRAKAKKERLPHLWTAATLLLLAVVAVAWPLWVAANRPRATAGLESEASGIRRVPPTNNTRHVSSTRRDQQPRQRDGAVTPAGYSESIATPGTSAGTLAASSNELRLPAERTIPADSLKLKPGQRVCARSGRARVAVGREGFSVRADRVTFENIDFIADESAAMGTDGEEGNSTLLDVSCPECAFVGCSFQSALGRPELRTAVLLRQADGEGNPAVALPSRRIRVKNCVFRRVASGIESRAHAAVVLEIANTLHLGPGPMIRLTHCPAADEPLRIGLAQVTLREADALVDCRFSGGDAEGAPTPAGEVVIEATGCALAPRQQAALLMLACDAPPGALLGQLKWTGQSSVVAPNVAFARWQRRDGAAQVVDDAAISISGLVRGRIDFVAPSNGTPGNSRIVECEAPLQDSDSLGANVAGLPAEIDAPGDSRR